MQSLSLVRTEPSVIGNGVDGTGAPPRRINAKEFRTEDATDPVSTPLTATPEGTDPNLPNTTAKSVARSFRVAAEPPISQKPNLDLEIPSSNQLSFLEQLTLGPVLSESSTSIDPTTSTTTENTLQTVSLKQQEPSTLTTPQKSETTESPVPTTSVAVEVTTQKTKRESEVAATSSKTVTTSPSTVAQFVACAHEDAVDPVRSWTDFIAIPDTRFACSARVPGYYADPENACRVFHHCDALGSRISFLCPACTLFNEERQLCDFWYNVDCAK